MVHDENNAFTSLSRLPRKPEATSFVFMRPRARTVNRPLCQQEVLDRDASTRRKESALPGLFALRSMLGVGFAVAACLQRLRSRDADRWAMHHHISCLLFPRLLQPAGFFTTRVREGSNLPVQPHVSLSSPF